MKKLLAVATLLAALAVGPPAAAGEPDILDRDFGYGRAVASSWSRGYGHIAFMARYSGHADAVTAIRCANGFTDRQSWTDAGPMFRYVVRVPRYVRCVERFTLETRGSFVALLIGAF